MANPKQDFEKDKDMNTPEKGKGGYGNQDQERDISRPGTVEREGQVEEDSENIEKPL